MYYTMGLNGINPFANPNWNLGAYLKSMKGTEGHEAVTPVVPETNNSGKIAPSLPSQAIAKTEQGSNQHGLGQEQRREGNRRQHQERRPSTLLPQGQLDLSPEAQRFLEGQEPIETETGFYTYGSDGKLVFLPHAQQNQLDTEI